jgi:peptide subunit release factor 1 (eRF1)
MPRSITWDELRDLAAFEGANGCAVSLYLGLDPAAAATSDPHTRLNSLLDEGAKANGANARELSHEQRLGLRSDFERIRRYVEEELDREGAHGLAVFSAGLDNVWRALPLTESVADAIKVNRRLYLAPLVPLVGRGEGAIVVVVGREQGHFYRLRAGRLEELADRFEEQPRRHDQGGWAQSRLQRHVDVLAQEHVRAIAAELDTVVRRLHAPQVVVVASEEIWSEFAAAVSAETRNAVAGWTHAEAHAGTAELLAVAAPVLESWRTAREAEAVERWLEETGRRGKACGGWRDTLEAASDGRVELLLFQEGSDRPAWSCPSCSRVSAEGGRCPLDGRSLDPDDDGLDLAVHRTLAHGGTVWSVRRRDDLAATEGIGALLRY